MKKPSREKQIITYDYLAGFKRIKDEYLKQGWGYFRVKFGKQFYDKYPDIKAIVVMDFFNREKDKQKYVAVGMETIKEAKKLWKEVSKIIC